MATALRIYCAERTRAMQLACMCASRLVPTFHITFVPGMTWGTSVLSDMAVRYAADSHTQQPYTGTIHDKKNKRIY